MGELFIAGYHVTMGYVNQPDKNAESLVPNPFTSEKDYDRMYTTGDYARLLSDGTVGILGRRDG